jgi:hypothetical protein
MIKNINITIVHMLINLVVAMIGAIIFAQVLDKTMRGTFASEIVAISLIPVLISPLLVPIELRFEELINNKLKFLNIAFALFALCILVNLVFSFIKPAAYWVEILRLLIAYTTVMLVLLQKVLMAADKFFRLAVVSVGVSLLYIICVSLFVTSESSLVQLLSINAILPAITSIIYFSLFLLIEKLPDIKIIPSREKREIFCTLLSDLVNYSLFKAILIAPFAHTSVSVIADHRIAMTFSDLLLKVPNAVSPVIRAMTINNTMVESHGKQALYILISINVFILGLFILFGETIIILLFGEKYITSYDEAILYISISILLLPRIVNLSRLQIKASFSSEYIIHSFFLLLLTGLSYYYCSSYKLGIADMLNFLIVVAAIDFLYLIWKLNDQ